MGIGIAIEIGIGSYPLAADPGAPAGSDGTMDFSDEDNSALIALLEDI